MEPAERVVRALPRLLLGLAVALLLVLLGVRLAGAERGTPLQLLLNALPLSLLPAYPLLVLAVVLRARWQALGAAVAIVGHVVVVAPALTVTPLPEAARAAPTVRVVTANLFVRNPDPGQAGRALRRLRPDVLVVPELTGAGLAGLEGSGVLDDLPHRVVELGGSRSETVGLFSRLPLRDRGLRRGGTRALPRATLVVDGVEVLLLPTHPLPPFLGWEPLWRRSLADLAAEVRAARLPVLVAGDLNADRDQAAFRALLDAGLRDAHDERGRGLVRTWPADRPLMHLDHVLVRDGEGGRLHVRKVREATVPGSDHRAVTADVAVVRVPPARGSTGGRGARR